ncbi:MAG TPA: glycosyltransferase family 39 protein [Bryobacteraceae bacterium]|nr:glycosyltransferase family 39 protein [Bryobacteraceae bacterium]
MSIENVFFAALLAAVILRLWILPLRNGFWLDETGTFWAAQGTLREVLSHSLLWPSQFPAYSVLMWTMLHVPGPPEILMRLPSIAAMAIGVCFVFRIGVRLASRRAAWIAAVVFTSLEPVAFAAADARPYALGLMAVCGAMLMLLRWLERGSLRDGLIYAVLVALTWHMHYTFATTFIAQAAYVTFVAYRRRVRLNFLQLPWIVLTALLLGSLSETHLAAMLHTATSHGFAGSPNLAELFTVLAPPALTCTVVLGLAIACVFTRAVQVEFFFSRPEHLVFLLSWLLLPAVIPFAVSVVSNAKIFLPRYILPYTPALALLLGLLIASIRPAAVRIFVLLAAISASIVSAHGLADVSHGGDWRMAMRALPSISDGSPILFRSGFPESNPFNWQTDFPRTAYLLAPLAAYPVAGDIIALPFRFDTAAHRELEQITASRLESRDRFVLLEMGDTSYDFWLTGRLSAAGFHSRTVAGFGGPHDSLRILIFSKARA